MEDKIELLKKYTSIQVDEMVELEEKDGKILSYKSYNGNKPNKEIYRSYEILNETSKAIKEKLNEIFKEDFEVFSFIEDYILYGNKRTTKKSTIVNYNNKFFKANSKIIDDQYKVSINVVKPEDPNKSYSPTQLNEKELELILILQESFKDYLSKNDIENRIKIALNTYKVTLVGQEVFKHTLSKIKQGRGSENA